ncbi:MAG: alcohol dehydrogenase catalytic domain-containing protein, partial [Syntrophomonadaceae bacterium]|nr:alcohol dehydrogenase catalytic domain-containing protein [Syntrophomonadaceae bacterium]
MKAVVFRANKDIRLEEVRESKIERMDDALVRVTTSTICGSDIHIKNHGETMGILPGTVIGHEFVGIVEEVGESVNGFAKGDRVAVSCIFNCGQCFYCKKGNISMCTSGTVFGGRAVTSEIPHGCQTELVRIPYASQIMHKIPSHLSDDDVLFVGDILSTGFFGAERGEIKLGDTVVIIGAGPVGVCAAIGARLLGAAQIIMLDMEAYRLQIAKEQNLADIVVNIKSEDTLQVILDSTGGRGADVVIEAVGSSQSFQDAFNYIRAGGTVSLLGVYTAETTFAINKHWRKNLNVKMGLVEVKNMGS